MRISDWSSDVCSSDLAHCRRQRIPLFSKSEEAFNIMIAVRTAPANMQGQVDLGIGSFGKHRMSGSRQAGIQPEFHLPGYPVLRFLISENQGRSEEHTSELQSLMRISYAVFCLKKKKNIQ